MRSPRAAAKGRNRDAPADGSSGTGYAAQLGQSVTAARGRRAYGKVGCQSRGRKMKSPQQYPE